MLRILQKRSPSFGLRFRSLHDLRIRNSLLSNPETNLSFLSLDKEKGRNSPRTLSWYSCGPTVYDVSHLGHARTYVSTDAIRRILQSYFGITIDFAMGITDIDDKIIARAKESESGQGDNTTWNEMISYGKQYETSFFKNMDELGVQRPNAVLRVSEHMPEIELYVEKLLNGNAAYHVDGMGAYFDVKQLTDESYGQLGSLPPNSLSTDQSKPTDDHSNSNSIGNNSKNNNSKRYFRDFSLWKIAKTGEPSYTSTKLGDGRPGWHIECSAITNSYFGSNLDIHSGGIDLKFPHHTNEIAQSEAYNRLTSADTSISSLPWVKLWLHTGHLYIDGSKMSKSLKNFISIDEYFNSSKSPYPAIDFRIFCLSHKYHSSLHYSSERIHEAGVLRERLVNVIDICQLFTKNKNRRSGGGKPSTASRALTKELQSCQQEMRGWLCDDFNTPAVLQALNSLAGQAIQYSNTHLMNTDAADAHPIEPIVATANFIEETCSMMGIDFSVTNNSNSNSNSNKNNDNNNGNGNGNDEAQIMSALLDFRSQAREAALNGVKSKDPNDSHSKIACDTVLKLCDNFRDVVAPNMGYQLKDVGDTTLVTRTKK